MNNRPCKRIEIPAGQTIDYAFEMLKLNAPAYTEFNGVFLTDANAVDTYYSILNERSEKEMVDHPAHYNKDDVETIDKMIRIWGKSEVASWCKITAFMYRDRAGYKGDIIEDIEKALWFERKYKELNI